MPSIDIVIGVNVGAGAGTGILIHIGIRADTINCAGIDIVVCVGAGAVYSAC